MDKEEDCEVEDCCRFGLLWRMPLLLLGWSFVEFCHSVSFIIAFYIDFFSDLCFVILSFCQFCILFMPMSLSTHVH